MTLSCNPGDQVPYKPWWSPRPILVTIVGPWDKNKNILKFSIPYPEGFPEQDRVKFGYADAHHFNTVEGEVITPEEWYSKPSRQWYRQAFMEMWNRGRENVTVPHPMYALAEVDLVPEYRA